MKHELKGKIINDFMVLDSRQAVGCGGQCDWARCTSVELVHPGGETKHIRIQRVLGLSGEINMCYKLMRFDDRLQRSRKGLHLKSDPCQLCH